MKINAKRGFNRLFVVLTALWVVYCLFAYPIQQRQHAHEVYAREFHDCLQRNDALFKECFQFCILKAFLEQGIVPLKAIVKLTCVNLVGVLSLLDRVCKEAVNNPEGCEHNEQAIKATLCIYFHAGFRFQSRPLTCRASSYASGTICSTSNMSGGAVTSRLSHWPKFCFPGKMSMVAFPAIASSYCFRRR